MFRPRPFALVLAFAAAVAVVPAGCSNGGDETPDAGGPAAPDDAYFGLADRKCFRYTSGGGFTDFTLEMTVDVVTIPGVRTFHVITKQNGLRQFGEEWWFQVTDEAMLIHRRRAVEGNKDSFWIFDPPAVWLKKGIELGAEARTDTTARVSGVRSGSFATTYSVSALSTDPMTVAGQTVDATKYTITRAETGQNPAIDKIWFAPNVGIVKIDPSGTAVGEESLVSSGVLQAAETCE